MPQVKRGACPDFGLILRFLQDLPPKDEELDIMFPCQRMLEKMDAEGALDTVFPDSYP
jgi:hypothetical protein